jgi:serine/threonine-protein kinase
MGCLGLALAALAGGIYVTGRYVQPGWIDPAQAPALYAMCLYATAAVGLLLFTVSRLPMIGPTLALDFGLVMQVAAGLFISLAENAVPYPVDTPVRGSSAIAVWIAVFALGVPASFGKAILAALSTAAMGPVGLCIHIMAGNVASPPASMWLTIFPANFLMAVAAATMGKLIYRLGVEVGAVREYGGYRLLEPLGSGGMGEVWLARHRLVEREAAVKLIRPEALGGDRSMLVRRFEREAQATARLHSPHTVSLYNYGVSEDGLLYYVMEYLEGYDLEKLVKRTGPLPASRTAFILHQVCESLIEAHEAGLIHRDIKPQNILLCRLGASYDFVKVLDFGLVKMEEGGDLTRGAIAGTPSYLAPEIALGNAAGARSDIYSAGCVAYWLLTGRTPFDQPTEEETVQAHAHEIPTPPSRRTVNEIPSALEEIVMACLEKNPDLRPQTARELARRLGNTKLAEGWDRARAEACWPGL